MSTTVTLNGATYSIPAVGERLWGNNVSNYLIATAGATLQKSGGTFTLTADVNFGANYGLVSKYFKSTSSNIATSGVVRFSNNEGLAWRNAANNADIALKVNASDQLEFNGTAFPAISSIVTVTGAQTLTDKTLEYLRTSTDSAALAVNILTITKGLMRITGGGTQLNSLSGMANDGAQVVLLNNSGSDITVTNSGNIQTGTGSNFTLKDGASAPLVYSGSLSKWVLAGGSAGGGLATSIKSGAFTGAAGNHYLCNTGSGTFTATLPAGTTGAVIRFSDDTRSWSTNNLTIAPATGETIGGLSTNESLVCDLSGAFVQLAWDGSRWVIDTNGYAASITTGSLSSAQGMGAKNYCSNPDNASNWTASGAGIAVSTETSTSLLPNGYTKTSAIKILRASGSDYVRHRFTLDKSDYGKKFQISFDQAYAGTAGDYTVTVYSNTASDYTGTSTALTLQTSSISTLNGSFVTTVDMPGSTAPYIEVRVNGVAGTTALYLNNFYVGPGIQVQGAAVTYLGTYTPVFTSSGATNLGLNASRNTLDIWRVGDTLKVRGTIQKDTNAPGGTTSNILVMSLPTGLTSAKAAVSDYKYGTYSRYVSAYEDEVPIVNSLGNGIAFASPTTTSVRQAGSMGASSYWYIDMEVPIAEWAGSGTVNLGPGAQVEYAATSGTWDADSSTTVYGSAGQAIGGTLTTGRIKTVTWQYPIQADDQIVVEGSIDRITWTPMNMMAITGGVIIPGMNSGATIMAGVACGNISSTQTKVVFGQYIQIANDDTPVYDWPASGLYWRVRKAKASAPVGFGLAGTDGSSGLYKAGQAPGYTGASAIPTGYVGELAFGTLQSGTGGAFYQTSTTTAVTTSAADLVSVTLNKGVYLISGYTKMTAPSGSAVNITSFYRIGGTAVGASWVQQSVQASAETSLIYPTIPMIITADATVVSVRSSTNVGTATNQTNQLYVVRIA